MNAGKRDGRDDTDYANAERGTRVQRFLDGLRSQRLAYFEELCL